MTTMPHDAALVARLRARDESAFEALLRTHMPRLLRVARRFLRDEEDARDAVQDAFVSAFKSIDRFDAASSLSTWLHRIVVNASLMKLRTKRRHPEEDIDALLPRFREDGHQVEPSTAWSMSAEELVAQSETREFVRRAIDMLPETHRIVLLMRDIEEMSTEETAQALGITPAAVKVRLHRARQALRALLDRHLKEGHF